MAYTNANTKLYLWIFKKSLNNNIPEMAAFEEDTHMKKYHYESLISNNKLILYQRQWQEIEKGMSKYLQKKPLQRNEE